MSRRLTLTFLKKNWEFSIAVFILAYYLLVHVVLGSAHRHHDSGLNAHLRVIPQDVISHWDQASSFHDHTVEKYAYVQYATGYDYLNMAIINFILLKKSGSAIKNMVVLYDSELQRHHVDHWQRLHPLASKYGITLKSVTAITADSKDSSNWAASFTKFHVFDQTQYDRIVFFDLDSMLVPDSNGQWQNIDELFKIPQNITYALPQAYWLNNIVELKEGFNNVYHKKVEIPSPKRYHTQVQGILKNMNRNADQFLELPTLIYDHHKYDNRDDFFANHVMVLTPSKKVYNELLQYIHNPWHWSIFSRSKLKKKNDYDMEILNKYLDDQLRSKEPNTRVGVLPHRTYGVLTGEFKERWHRRFVVEPQHLPFITKQSSEGWDASQARKDAKLIHFSDSPIPKPWDNQDSTLYYNQFKIYCAESARKDPATFRELYPGEWQPRLVDDCEAVLSWNSYRATFYEVQKEFWVV
ncbi:glycosyltransferase family 8 protein [Suhomyces tanzawaensis NRRL Y-17324]|uniref:Glycosyltransferase family 8 protein n=1 Tax=Suhomyces tanzawaensis NRRL Y-17324 TaxID=984487 RepID=A0A1E4SM05_9ASCO|nr:glycosyltransferase family 8 protein [Suhomyces tanzawaensis NRRL Y-17324]ODV80518.1 glycosyltransferase family 8 protein [Suhomyces tanzawaensis NRRL Y-17324]